MIRVLFICHGNICRSPMAEFIIKDHLRKLGLEEEFYVASAATSSEEIWDGVGNPVYPPARAELAKHGISCGQKRAVQLVKEDYEKYDYLIGMEQMNILSDCTPFPSSENAITSGTIASRSASCSPFCPT